MNSTKNEEEYAPYDGSDIPARIRRLVLRRDNYRCRYCGNENTEQLTLHHVQYRSQGGTHDPDNLVTLCYMPCHRKIHDGRLNVILINGHWFFKTL